MAPGAGRARGDARVSTTAVVDQVREARSSRAPVRIRGAGTWLDAGRPVAAARTLSLADDRGVVEYVPGDLTLTARAGTTLMELEQVTREHGQWLPLAPWGRPDGTLGATISTATAGPYAAAFGLPRDAVLGVEFVTGTADVVRSGGRVVKNVAGFDLTRLVIGSWGTLGVITEATVRLRSLPQVSRTLTIAPVVATEAALTGLAAAVRALPFAPCVCELLNPAMARALGLDARTTLLVQLGGNPTSVAAQLDALRQLGAAADAPADLIDRLRAADTGMTASWRQSGKPSSFARTWTLANATPGALVHGSMSRGVVRVAAAAGTRLPSPAAAGLVIERLPRDLWPAGKERDPLAEAIRSRFDPDRVLNPGIMGDLA